MLIMERLESLKMHSMETLIEINTQTDKKADTKITIYFLQVPGRECYDLHAGCLYALNNNRHLKHREALCSSFRIDLNNMDQDEN